MQFVAFLIFPMLMAYAAASDLLWMRLPNWLTALVAVSFFLIAPLAHVPAALIGWNALCALIVLAGGFALFAFGWIGGGDAKLAAGVAAWLGFQDVLSFVLLGAILGGVLTLLILQFRRLPLPHRLQGEAWLARLHDRSQGVPYGVALAAAALHLFPSSQMWTFIAGL